MSRELLDAIIAGDTLAMESAFESAVNDKVVVALDTFRQEVAGNLFAGVNESELTLEDYSVEELEEFMMSEDYEALDEVSKETLGSYVNKAVIDYGVNKSNYTTKLKLGNNAPHGSHDEKLNWDAADKSLDKTNKRRTGIATAIKKLTKA